MSKAKKSNQMKFWTVLLGLFLLIGLIVGGTYVLNDQGLISVGGMGAGEMPEGDPPDFAEGTTPPERPKGDGESMGFNSQALTGLLKVLLQIVLVVVAVAGGQWLISCLQRRRRWIPKYLD